MDPKSLRAEDLERINKYSPMVYRILTDHMEERRFIDLTEASKDMPMKWVAINGRGGPAENELFAQYFGKGEPPLFTAYVTGGCVEGEWSVTLKVEQSE